MGRMAARQRLGHVGSPNDMALDHDGERTGMTDQERGFQEELEKATRECVRLRQENARLRGILGLSARPKSLVEEATPPAEPASESAEPVIVNNLSPAQAKIALFRSLFHGRDDVFAVRWEGKGGRSGYSPACGNEWKRPLCGSPLRTPHDLAAETVRLGCQKFVAGVGFEPATFGP